MEIIKGSEKELVVKASERIKSILLKGLERHDHCNILLSGGESPVSLYNSLADEIDFWDRINVFLGDERFVLSNDHNSNQGMIKKELVEKTELPDENTYFPPIIDNLHVCAEEYNFTLKSHFDNFGAFDLALIGVGEDGHILSLFPKSCHLAADNHFYLPVEGELPRLTGTFELLKKVKQLVVFAPGKNKLGVIDRVMNEDVTVEDFPIRWVVENVENALWFISK